MKVAEILASKGSLVITVKPTDTIGALSTILREHRIGAAVVSSDGQTADGVITERDIAFGLAQHGGAMHTLPVASLMTRAVVSCRPQDDVSLVSSTMLSRNIRHIPVLDGGRLAGMVSIRDVLKVQVGMLQQEAALLRGLVNDTERVPQDR
jgi:CBS domain-containing protein